MKIIKERSLVQKIKKRLEKNGFLVIKISTPFLKGFPDLIVIKNGITSFLEVKQNRKKLTKVQDYFLKTLRGYKVYAECIDIENFNEVIKSTEAQHAKNNTTTRRNDDDQL